MRLRIASAFGVPIFLHWTFFLLPLLIWWTRPEESPSETALIFTLLPLLFVCVVLHEFGHILMARRFGIPTQDVTLYPIGGVARLKRMSDQPFEELLIALAGPAVNVAIAVVLGGVYGIAAVMDPRLLFPASPGSGFVGDLLFRLLALNVVMVLFNLLPAFPMDGGRVLRALLAWWLGLYRATQIAVYVGMGMAILIGLAGLSFNSFLPAAIGLFVMFTGQQELLAVRIREQRRRRWDDEEPLTVLPADPDWQNRPTQVAPQAPMLTFQPRISVYTWDSRTGTWRQEPGTLA